MAQRTVIVGWTVSSQNFPAGTELGAVHVEIGGAKLTEPLVMDVTAPGPDDGLWKAVFNGVEEEAETDPNYTYSVQQFDSKGVSLGAAITGNFSVIAPPSISLDVPSVVTITVQ